jgi:hypothetical protein
VRRAQEPPGAVAATVLPAVFEEQSGKFDIKSVKEGGAGKTKAK